MGIYYVNDEMLEVNLTITALAQITQYFRDTKVSFLNFKILLQSIHLTPIPFSFLFFPQSLNQKHIKILKCEIIRQQSFLCVSQFIYLFFSYIYFILFYVFMLYLSSLPHMHIILCYLCRYYIVSSFWCLPLCVFCMFYVPCYAFYVAL